MAKVLTQLWLYKSKIICLLNFLPIYSCSYYGDVTNNFRSGDTILIGNVTDSTREGQISYKLHDTIVGKEYFNNNKLNGVSEFYYSSGLTRIRSEYSQGVLNGFRKYFYENSAKQYSDFHFHGLLVGPITFYDSIGQPSRYFFSSLENVTLLYIDYSKWQGIQDKAKDLFYFSINNEFYQNVKKNKLFIYLPQPPRIKLEYGIYVKDSLNNGEPKKQFELKSNLPFANIEISQNILENGAIGVMVYDSILNKETIVYRYFKN